MKKWTADVNESLSRLYQQTNITSDSLIKDQKVLSNFTATLNREIKGIQFSEKEVADQLLKLRKSGKLPRLRH